ncbi:MAG: acyl-CoA dehydrogenase, partial [Caulobacteraceae bacterium]|nr:acyl-CoA dehydrogenase [Caulobacteraceae bacterium]
YEGTNGIQAIDLIGRKLARDQGAAFHALIDEILHTEIAPEVASLGERLAQAVDAAQASAEWLIQNAGTPDALAGASDFLLLLAETVGGWMHARAAATAGRDLALPGADRAYLEGRLKRARLYGERVLARTPQRAAAVMQGAGEL